LKKISGRLNTVGIFLGPAVFWTGLFALPLFLVFTKAVKNPGELIPVILSPYYLRILWFTVFQAGLSTIFSILLGFPGAYLIGRHLFPGRRLLKSLSTVPFVLPSILVVLGFILVFGNSGLVNTMRKAVVGSEVEPWNILYSLKAIIMAHTFYNFPITLRIVGDAWSALPQSSYKAARSLGSGRLRRFIMIDLPALAPAILTSAIFTFLLCFMSFAVVLVLGGSPEFSTLEVEVYRLVKYQLDFDSGSILALLESMAALILLAVYARMVRKLRRNSQMEANGASARTPTALRGKSVVLALIYLIPTLLFILAPLLSIFAHSFVVRATRLAPLHFSLNHWKRLFGAGEVSGLLPILSALRTVVLGAVVAITTTLTASLAGWYTTNHHGWSVRLLKGMMFLPMGVSSIILGLGLLLMAHWIPANRAVSLVLLMSAHTMIALPFAYRIISGRMREISSRIPQAARAAGAGPIKTLFMIVLPLSRPALVSVSVFTLALSAGELNASLILAPAGFTTLPLAIYRMISAYDIFGASALGTLLIGISALSFLILDRYGGTEYEQL